MVEISRTAFRLILTVLSMLNVINGYYSRLPPTLSFYPAASNQSSQFFEELRDDMDMFQAKDPEIVSFLESCCEIDYRPERLNMTSSLNQWPSSVVSTLVLDIPNRYFKSESSSALLLRSNLSIEAKAHFIQLMNDAYVSDVIRAMTTTSFNVIQYPVIKFTLLQKIIKGRVSTVITWSDFNKLASSGILHRFFSQGLDINSVTTVVNNEIKLNLISQVLQQGERIIGEYIRMPICRILLDHIFRMKNYAPISAWQSKDTLLSISPYIECLEPQMLPEKQKYSNWIQLFEYIAQSHEIDPTTCLLLLNKLDSHAWSRITTETKFLCLRYATPRMAQGLLWHWEQKYETELAINGFLLSIQDMALQNTLKREKLSELSMVKRNEKMFELICGTYLHLMNYEELESLFGLYYVAIPWNKISIQQVSRMDLREIKQTLKYIKDHRLSPKSPWSERDLDQLGSLVIGLSSEEILQSHLKFFFRDGKKFIKYLGVPQKVKLLMLISKELPGINGGLSLANIREYDMDLLNYLSAYDLMDLIGRTFESGYYIYSYDLDRIQERLPTDLLSKTWDARISSVIYINVLRTISKSPYQTGPVSLTGPMSESMGPILLGADYKDLLEVRYSEWLSVINSFQFHLKKGGISRGLAQTLASYFQKVVNDLFGPNMASERHTEPSFRMHMHLLGGIILREVDPKFFLNVPAYLCREAISMIGELKDNINLPRKMRQQIVHVYLSHCKRDPSLDFVDLVSLGSLVCDLPAGFLDKMANKSLLQERIHYFKQCSLSILQGEVLKNMVPKPIISYQNILNLQSTICSMIKAEDFWLLNDTEKEAIAPAVPYIWKDLHPFMFSQNIRYSELLWDREEAFLEGLDVESQKQLGSCIRNTAWVYAVEFQKDTSYYYQKDCKPENAENDRSTHTCAQLKDLGASIALLPEDYYQEMNVCQLKRCIFYISTQPYMTEKVLRRVFKVFETALQTEYMTNDSLASIVTSRQPLLWYDLPVFASFTPEVDYPNMPYDIDFLYQVQLTLTSNMEPRFSMLEYLLSRYLKMTSKNGLEPTDIAGLGNILCGSTFKATDDRLILRTRTNTANIFAPDFRSSLQFLGKLRACTDAQLSELVTFYESIQNVEQMYKPAEIVDLGLIISASSVNLLNSFERDQIKMINCDVIRRISEAKFKQLNQLFFLRLSPEQIRCFTPNQWKHVKDYKIRIVNNNLCSQFRFSDGAFSCLVSGNEFSDVLSSYDDENVLPKPNGRDRNGMLAEVLEFEGAIEGAIDNSIVVESEYFWSDIQYVTVFAFFSHPNKLLMVILVLIQLL